MFGKARVVLAAAVAYGAYSVVSGLLKNIRDAKRTGFNYVVVPYSPAWRSWQLTHKIWIPIIKLLPESWWESWIDLMYPEYAYQQLHKPFARHGETFLVVSPWDILVLTDSAEAIRQMTQRREHFPKMTEHYSVLAQFGDNVLTTEGAIWRMHRKAVSASFNEANAELVFAQSIRQAQAMCDHWMGPDGQGKATITTVDHDTMRFALNIIGYVGFGLRLLWPGQPLPADTDSKRQKYSSLTPPEGHSMSYVDAVSILLERIVLLLLVPVWMLKMLPFAMAKEAVQARENYVKYMNELYDDRVEDWKNDTRAEGMDLVGQMVRSKFGDKKQANGSAVKAKEPTNVLSKDEILGNAFIILVAGHETTANAMHFTLIELATNPSAQRQLQKDIDTIFGHSGPSTWDYEKSVNPMLACMIGACMNETLRLMPPVVEIPKKVVGEQGQILTIDGTDRWLPNNTAVSIVAAAAHRNPRNWPSRPSKIRPGEDDLNDYVPGRWFRTADSKAKVSDDDGEGEDFGGYRGSDTSAQLFRPTRGSYIPFSDGARSCLGRRIGQVEIIAALAVIFRQYTLELAVDEWATDKEVENMSTQERIELYQKAQDECRRKIQRATTILTLKLHGMIVPVRIVKRGQERFVNVVDA